MCAIAGCWFFNDATSRANEVVDSFVKLQRSRGPDGSGRRSFANGCLALGHCRLSILDLSENGAQPMRSHCGRFMEVREELSVLGHSFLTDSDTEVILTA